MSLALAAPITPGLKLLDVGTGAGFPGAVLAIAFPEITVTLLDSTLKRLRIVESLLTEIGITNASIVHARAGDGASAALHNSFDLVTARAVAAADKLAGWLLPFAFPGGLVAMYKALDSLDEITEAEPAMKRLGGKLVCCERVSLPGTEIVRIIALIEKSGRFYRPSGNLKK